MELKLFSEVNISKSGALILTNQLKENLLSGEMDVIDFISKVEVLKNSLEELKKDSDVRDCILREVETYGKYGAERKGVKVCQAEVGVKYDFENCNDRIIEELLIQQEEIKNKIKERTDFLKNIPDGGITELDEETGEYRRIVKPAKSSTTTFKITLPK